MAGKTKTDLVADATEKEVKIEETIEQLLDKIIALEELNKTQKELNEKQTQSINILSSQFIKSSNLLNRCLSVLQNEGYSVRNAGSSIERFYEENKNSFLDLILMGKKIAGIDINKQLTEKKS